MTESSGSGPSRRDLATVGSTFLAALLASPADATAALPAGALPSTSIDVTQSPFAAVGDGHDDDAPAIHAAIAALPVSGGTIFLPGPRIYRIGRTIDDHDKPVVFEIGHAQIVGPSAGPIFDLRTNGSMIKGRGRGATILRLAAPAAPVVAPTYNLNVHDGRIRDAALRSAGKELCSTPLIEIADSPSGDSAAVIVTVRDGQVIHSDLVSPGRGYVQRPGVTMVGGGECAIRISEANGCHVVDLTIDMSNIPHAVGIFQNGGWYADLTRIDIIAARQHGTAIALLIDSHTLGGPGKNESYGGSYVSRYSQMVAKRTVVIGHDTSTATTLHFDTLDAATIHLHGAVAVLLSNVVLQEAEDVFLDLVNVDGVTMIGGDIEGTATLVRARGRCDNVRLAPLSYSASGPVLRGPIGGGWRLDLASGNNSREVLETGNAGSAGMAFQNAGWVEKHRLGIHYSGASVVWSSNVKLVGPNTGILDNPRNAGLALIMTISGQLILRIAPPGEGKVQLSNLAQFDSAGLMLAELPSSPPQPGSKRLWYDPADKFRLKFAP